ncbi:hypothetical protein B4U80_14867 [Leptotrombidium deliense]|uniref:Peptidase M12B domain-containing protein n=1 Tax=Leptotrombidium deliense TaxID=299467 RepID=A0A443SBM9_9ACAR|nr:hypothetical protein B4U80_14867 [Leptotrombidium deliense]
MKSKLLDRRVCWISITLDHAVSFTLTKYTNYDNVQYNDHELSHNLGMDHDTPACKCGKEKMCTMAMGNKGLGKKWSDSSLNECNIAINNQDLDCLKEKQKTGKLEIVTSGDAKSNNLQVFI